MDADDGHQQSGDQSDDDAAQKSGGERGGQPQSKRRAACMGRHDRGQDPSHQQARLICRGYDRQIDAARNEGDSHRQREQPELRKLKHHRLERGDARKGRWHKKREGRNEQSKQREETGDIEWTRSKSCNQLVELA